MNQMGEGAAPQLLSPHSLSEAEINHYDKNMLPEAAKRVRRNGIQYLKLAPLAKTGLTFFDMGAPA